MPRYSFKPYVRPLPTEFQPPKAFRPGVPRPVNDNSRPTVNDNLPPIDWDGIGQIAQFTPWGKFYNWAKAAGYIAAGVIAADELYELWKRMRQAYPDRGSWRFLRTCSGGPPSTGNSARGTSRSALGGCTAALTVWPQYRDMPVPIDGLGWTFPAGPGTYLHHEFAVQRAALPTVADRRDFRVYQRVGTVPRARAWHPAWTMPDPNLQVGTPALPPSDVPGQLGGEPLVRSPAPPTYMRQWDPPGIPRTPPSRAGGKRPPSPRTKERKTKSKLAQLFGFLDVASEWSELVDALYDALPDDVKKRWGKDRDSRGLVDNAGQYGFDGADWKAQALWHNWHKLDTGRAVKNIIANEVQDKLYGALYKTLPRNIGRAVDPAMKEWNDMITDLNELGFSL